MCQLWACLGLVAITACAGQRLPKSQISSPGEALFNGEVRADIDCYRCHNGDAAGTWRGPNLTRSTGKMTDQQVAAAMAEGPGSMPSFKGKLSENEVKQIIAWLRSRAEAGAGK